MEVTFQKNVRLSIVDLILVGISVPDFSLKMSQKQTKMYLFSMFNFSKIEILLYSFFKI